MGQGANFVLINDTEYDWICKEKSSYQMDAWNFTDKIEKFSAKKIYVEWDENIFHTKSDDMGKVIYSLNDGSNDSFKIEFRNGNSKNIEVDISNIRRKNIKIKKNLLKLKWMHNGDINFGISGEVGNYIVMGDDYSEWMNDFYEDIKYKNLKNMCILGSHDSGMSECGTSAGGATASTTLTQALDIEGQLKLGARYFDIRPVISGGDFYTGHYNIDGFNCGSNGQKLNSIISQLNSFLKNKRELVILRISHAYNTDVGYGNYRNFDSDEWIKLINELKKINNRYINENINLKDCTMEDLISQSSSVIILLGADDCYSEYETISSLFSQIKNQGFYLKDNLKVYDKYFGKSNYEGMKKDQLEKLHNNSNKEDQLFLLSWTLTLEEDEVISTTLKLHDSILELAEKANSKLCFDLYRDIMEYKIYPNIIYLDKIDSTLGYFMSNIVNKKIKSTVRV